MKAAALFALASLAVLGVITSLRALSNDRQMLLQKTAELTASLQDRWALDIFDEREPCSPRISKRRFGSSPPELRSQV